MTDLKPGSRWLLPVTLLRLTGLTEPDDGELMTETGILWVEPGLHIKVSDLEDLIPASRLADLEAEVARLSGVIGNLNMDRMKMHGWLQDIEPHLDALICYASNMDEHPPNRTVKDVREYLNPKD